MDNDAASSQDEGMGDRVDDEGIDWTMPHGVYVPPSPSPGCNTQRLADDGEETGDAMTSAHHGGYVRIVDAKGKSFPCGFSRPIGVVMEEVKAARKKRNRFEMSDNAASPDTGVVDGVSTKCDGNSCNDSDDAQPKTHETEVKYEKRTITEERLHPEEALFLHLRGLLRVETTHADTGRHNGGGPKDGNIERNGAKDSNATMSTQDLFCKMLPECKVPLAAYLAYAHLRAQGYILIRYTNERMKLLREVNEQQLNDDSDNSNGAPRNGLFAGGDVKEEVPGGEALDRGNEGIPGKDHCEDELRKNEESGNFGTQEKRSLEGLDHSTNAAPENGLHDDEPQNLQTANIDTDDGVSMSSDSKERYRTRPLRLKLSDDVATAPPPCVVTLDDNGKEPTVRLAYYAYNPNARFRRSNPGLPDFGVAVMPFRSDDDSGEPKFDTLKSLVSMCEARDGDDDAKSGIPLRVVTVADGGAVIVFSVMNGEVPSINRPS